MQSDSVTIDIGEHTDKSAIYDLTEKLLDKPLDDTKVRKRKRVMPYLKECGDAFSKYEPVSNGLIAHSNVLYSKIGFICIAMTSLNAISFILLIYYKFFCICDFFFVCGLFMFIYVLYFGKKLVGVKCKDWMCLYFIVFAVLVIMINAYLSKSLVYIVYNYVIKAFWDLFQPYFDNYKEILEKIRIGFTQIVNTIANSENFFGNLIAEISNGGESIWKFITNTGNAIGNTYN